MVEMAEFTTPTGLLLLAGAWLMTMEGIGLEGPAVGPGGLEGPGALEGPGVGPVEAMGLAVTAETVVVLALVVPVVRSGITL